MSSADLLACRWRSVRGGTGCWYYKDESRAKPYVLDYKPDLVMIAGNSRGKQIVGRMLTRCFEPKDAAR